MHNVKVHGTFLHSRVARRIFAFFLACALIPAAGTAFLSIRQVDQLLLQQKRSELARLSKDNSVALYERLLLVEDLLQQLAPELSGDTGHGSDVSMRAKGKIASLALIRSNLTMQTVFGRMPAITYSLSAAERRHLADGKTVLFSVKGSGAERGVFMMRALGKKVAAQDYVVAELDERFLWADLTELPYRTDVCVFREADEVLYCSTATAPLALTAMAHDEAPSASRQLEWTDNGIRYLAGY